MDQLASIIQAGVIAIGALALVFVVIVILIVLQFISRIFTPRIVDEGIKPAIEDPTDQEDMLFRKEEPSEPKSSPASGKQTRPIYEKYPQVYRFEILYWRGVSKPWWWNNYAQDLINYYEEYFPHKKVNLSITYNSNSKSQDYNTSSLHKRILFLRTKKISKHPLVIINHDQDYIMVDSFPALEAMKDRIDAEWYRHYGFKKTYRHSPTEF